MEVRLSQGCTRAQFPRSLDPALPVSWGWRGSGALRRAVLTDCPPPPTRRAGATQTQQQLRYPQGEPGDSLGLEPQEEDSRDRLKMP